MPRVVHARRIHAALFALVLLMVSQAATAFETGEKVEVLSYGSWFEAEILEIRDDQFLVHYIGWDSSWDEWVSRGDIRYPQTTPTSDETEHVPPTVRDETPETIPFRPADNYEYRLGDMVEVRSGGAGFSHRAEIVEVDGERYRIRYDGYETTEWTGPGRIRLPEEGAVWDALMYRFHYDVSAEGVLGYFQHETPAPDGEYVAGNAIMDHEILIHKRETLFGRIDRFGRVSVRDHLLGRISVQGGSVLVRRNGRDVGTILADGTIRGGNAPLARIDEYGELVTSGGVSIGSIDPDTGYLIGYWGYASPTQDELDRKIVAAFLFFFTELPHAMERLTEY